jgi:hypothetical protein
MLDSLLNPHDWLGQHQSACIALLAVVFVIGCAL